MWLNGYYITKTTPERILELSKPFLEKAGVIKDGLSAEQSAYLEKAVALEQEKIKLLKEVPYHIGFFVKNPDYEEKAVNKYLAETGKKVLSELLPALEGCADWTVVWLEGAVRRFCEEKGYKPGDVFHPVRVAVSGKTKGPGLFEMLELLGREKVIERIKKWL